MKQAFRSVLRNRRMTFISIATVLAMTAFLLAFSNSIRLNQLSLDDAYDNLEVTAHIRGATAQSGPYLEETRIRAILGSGFVTEYSAMMRFKQRGNDTLRGVNSPGADPILEEALCSAVWLDGADETILQGNEPFCLAPIGSGLELGDEKSFFLLEKDTTVTVVVAGLYELEYGGDSMNYYCSLNWLEQVCREKEVPVFYNALELRLGNLRQLDDFKARMRELKMDEGRAILVINDALLREVTAQLKRQIRLLESVLPVLMLLVACIGFGLCFLLLQGRKKEAAVMRSLGMRRPQVAAVFLTESGIQALTGVLLGGLLARAVLGETAFQLNYLALVLICFLLGGAAAAWKISGVNVFSIMTARE